MAVGWEVLAKPGENQEAKPIGWICRNACYAVLHLGFDLEAEQLQNAVRHK